MSYSGIIEFALYLKNFRASCDAFSLLGFALNFRASRDAVSLLGFALILKTVAAVTTRDGEWEIKCACPNTIHSHRYPSGRPSQFHP